jgi:hypothetical protein
MVGSKNNSDNHHALTRELEPNGKVFLSTYRPSFNGELVAVGSECPWNDGLCV